MTSPSYTIIIDNHQVQCDSAESVIALMRAAGGKKTAAPQAAATATPASAPPAKKRRRRTKGAKATAKPMAAAAPAKAAPKKRSRKGGGMAKKAAGLSKRSVAFLNEFARSGGSTLNADRLAKATGAKGPKGVGGSLTALDRELKSFGYNLGSLIARKKTDDGTVWNALSGASSSISEILSKVPVV